MARAIGLLPCKKREAPDREEESILVQHARDLGVDWAHKIVELYMTETPHVAEGLNLALSKGDLVGISDIAHRIRGGANHVGAQTITAYAEAPERAADEGDWERTRQSVTTLLATLDGELKKLADQANRELDGTTAHMPFD